MKKKQMSIAEAQTAANQYMRNYLSNTPMGIPHETLGAEKYNAILDKVSQAIVEAWAAGFMAAR